MAMALVLARRLLLAAVLAGFGTASLSTAAFSAYPDRPIRWILSHPPGGSADVIARLMQPKLEKILGQPLIIENRAGAGGIIAMDALSKSKPDGYTIGMGASGSLATSPALGETVPYDPLKSFQPIAAVSGQPFMLAVPGDSPIKTIARCDRYGETRQFQADDRPRRRDHASHRGAVQLCDRAEASRW